LDKENHMSTWFTSNLGDAMLAVESLERIKALFLSGCEKPDDSREMAVFVRHESEGRLHCEVHVYFSPASVAVAKAVDATPCVKPSPGDLGLLAGSEESWAVLFPDSDFAGH
jgi:hypothetical protein